MKIQTKPFHVKVIYTFFAIVLLMLGLLGLMIPVLPGVIFLVAAFLLLAQVSTRVKRWVDAQPFLRSVGYRIKKMGQLQWIDRLRLGGWMMLGSIVNGARSLWLKVSSKNG